MNKHTLYEFQNVLITFQVGNLVKNLLSAFKELVGESVWMDEETKGKAKEKADSIVTMLGYPDWLPSPTELDNYYYGVSAFRIWVNTEPKIFRILKFQINVPSVDSHYDNIVRVMEWVSRKELRSLRETPERNT